jgi:hypothetical protein
VAEKEDNTPIFQVVMVEVVVVAQKTEALHLMYPEQEHRVKAIQGHQDIREAKVQAVEAVLVARAKLVFIMFEAAMAALD